MIETDGEREKERERKKERERERESGESILSERFFNIYIYIYIYMYACVCVCMFVVYSRVSSDLVIPLKFGPEKKVWFLCLRAHQLSFVI